MPSWAERQSALARLAESQLFFIGGAPRSGTTWLQTLLDGHPEISCGGEGLFARHLATPLDKMISEWRQGIEDKNQIVFRGMPGYQPPDPDDADTLLSTAILLALERQRGGKAIRAVGEKTPENVFFFPRLKRLFPTAKFIGIARDPRDVLTSAWHFFHQPTADADENRAKIEFIQKAIPSLRRGTGAMRDLLQRYPADCVIVTYETLVAAPVPALAHLFRFLGVSDKPAMIASCVDRASFGTQSRLLAGATEGRPFFRSGVAGGWRTTLTPDMNDMILQALGWAFPMYGWTP